LLQMVAPAFPPRSSIFLHTFGTPTLLWRVLQSVGYPKPPRYTWIEVETNGSMRWYDVRVIMPPHEGRPQWCGWSTESDGQSPWEGAQVVALEVLLDICQDFDDELINGPAESIPRVAPS
jgi:hypothetical protein